MSEKDRKEEETELGQFVLITYFCIYINKTFSAQKHDIHYTVNAMCQEIGTRYTVYEKVCSGLGQFEK